MRANINLYHGDSLEAMKAMPDNAYELAICDPPYGINGDKGSMSIAIACWDMGFDLELWEIDEDYYKAGAERFEKHKSQVQLFEPAKQEVKQLTIE